jgi:hypothetical protein
LAGVRVIIEDSWVRILMREISDVWSWKKYSRHVLLRVRR